MHTTLSLSEVVVKEVETLYGSENRSTAVEKTLEEAIHHKKLQSLMNLKGKITIDEVTVKEISEADDEGDD